MVTSCRSFLMVDCIEMGEEGPTCLRFDHVASLAPNDILALSASEAKHDPLLSKILGKFSYNRETGKLRPLGKNILKFCTTLFLFFFAPIAIVVGRAYVILANQSVSTV